MISHFFINRPVFASVLSIIIVMIGLISLKILPVAQYPDILPTTVTVSTTYLGANAETVANTVAAPLEQQINGVENMIYMSSTSANNGQLTITITFAAGTDPAQAEIDVNNRVQSILATLPNEVRQAGVNVNRASGSILQVISLSSPNNSYDSLYMSNYALLNVIDELKRLEGVGNASLFGALNYSMRIWIKPDKMAYHSLTADDIQSAITEQNAQFALGKFGQEPSDEENSFTYTLTTKGRLSTAEEFENIIIRTSNTGATLRLKDVAKVELGGQSYDFVSKLDGKFAVNMGIYLQTGANALDTTKLVSDKMEELSKNFPENMEYTIAFDTTSFVKISIKEVIKTFIESIILVIIVVFIFLQNTRATIIPLIAIPVSLIGTFAGMHLFGFSINLLTLFGMILAIGIVVDDAIIVIENIERIMREENLPAKAASIKAMEEVSGPVIAIVLVLSAVFLPITFITGIAGTIYRQFAITIVVSVILSGIVALTLTPSLCASYIKHDRKKNKFFTWFNEIFEKSTNLYLSGVKYFLYNPKVALSCFIILILSLLYLYPKLPNSLLPEEDQGYIIAAQILPQAASINRTNKVVDSFIDYAIKDPSVDHIVSLAGIDIIGGSGPSTNAGVSFVRFKDWDYRKLESQSSKYIANKFMGIASELINDGIVLAFNPPAIIGMSITGGFEAYIQYHGNDQNYLGLIEKYTNMFIEKSNSDKILSGVRTTFANNVPLYEIDLDLIKSKSLGLSKDNIFNTMQAFFGTIYVNDFSLYGRNYKVYMQADSEFRNNYNNIKDIFVRSSNGAMINLASVIKITPIIGLNSLDRFNIFPSAKITGSSAEGHSSGQALDRLEEIAKEILPKDFSLVWSGSSYQEKSASNTGMIAFIFSVIMIFLILAALYEKWSFPIAVILSVPFAIFGALLAQYLRGLNNDVYFQVGIVTLIGLSAKNAILIIEFAIIETERGIDVVNATVNAAKMRFRPIIMTSFAFILGCVPLYFSSGAGAASRHSIGTGIIGGMIASTFISTFFIPLFFKMLAKDKKISGE